MSYLQIRINMNHPIDRYINPEFWNDTTPRIMPESFSVTEEDENELERDRAEDDKLQMQRDDKG